MSSVLRERTRARLRNAVGYRDEVIGLIEPTSRRTDFRCHHQRARSVVKKPRNASFRTEGAKPFRLIKCSIISLPVHSGDNVHIDEFRVFNIVHYSLP